jgi:hypothetical protein
MSAFAISLKLTKLSGENLTGKELIVLTCFPYNIIWARDLLIFGHDCLIREDLQKVVELIGSLLSPGGYAIIFCAIQQFDLWNSELDKTDQLMADARRLLCNRAPGVYYQRPQRR